MINNLCCHICNSSKLVKFFDTTDVPVHQNYIYDTELSAKNANKGDLALYICKECGFVFNSVFDISKMTYDNLYDNTQDISEAFSKYIDKEIDFLVNTLGMRNKRVVEVGCGKGTFLKRLVERSQSIGVGFDPSYIGKTVSQDGKIKFFRKFYDKNCTNVFADLVICRHVIEHISDPISLLSNIKLALKNSPNALLFFETPSVNWILKNNIIYDFFYEHCSYFDDYSILKAFEHCGFNIEKIIHEFNGQYMWIVARNENGTRGDTTSDIIIDDFGKLALDYAEDVTKKIKQYKSFIYNLSESGKVAVWGAGAKGVTFLNLVDQAKAFVDCVIDINVNKQERYIAGTGHKIVSYTDIVNREIKYIIVMNSNYLNEIRKTLEDNKINVQIILGEDIK